MELKKDYTPDFIYNDCRAMPSACTVCNNMVYSNILDGYVHDTERGKVFCPFGKGESLNQSIYAPQLLLDRTQGRDYLNTKWGHAPQLYPRPLTKIGLEWRTD
jgi:hypothetical protein